MEIKMIPVTKLQGHPENPRKDLGDLTELSASIKANGVMQNLTVVEKPGLHFKSYTVIIGHRRLAAAKLAGIEELPCAVVEMSEEEQLSTMLVENMQRSDLTLYEQAKGFQMMLDLGKSIDEVSEMSGFSPTTIRKRTKLIELDEGEFKKACDRGATLFELAELDSIDSADVKNEVLKTAGTANFKNALKRAVEDQNQTKRMADMVKAVDEFAVKIETSNKLNGEDHPMDLVRSYYVWGSGDMPVKPKEDGPYYYVQYSGSISLYCDHKDKPKDPEVEKREQERIEHEAKTEELKATTERHKELRMEFVKDFNQYKKMSAEVSDFITNTLLWIAVKKPSFPWDNSHLPELAKFIGVEWNSVEKDFNASDLLLFKSDNNIRAMFLIAYWMRECIGGKYWKEDWNRDERRYMITANPNSNLDEIYHGLEQLGYTRSTEETDLCDGRHEYFEKVEAG